MAMLNATTTIGSRGGGGGSNLVQSLQEQIE